jgi:hypothetical protein
LSNPGKKSTLPTSFEEKRRFREGEEKARILDMVAEEE